MAYDVQRYLKLVLRLSNGQHGMRIDGNQSKGIAPHVEFLAFQCPHLFAWPFHYSGFPSERINLSPFTKDFRGGEQHNECQSIFLSSAYAAGPPLKKAK